MDEQVRDLHLVPTTRATRLTRLSAGRAAAARALVDGHPEPVGEFRGPGAGWVRVGRPRGRRLELLVGARVGYSPPGHLTTHDLSLIPVRGGYYESSGSGGATTRSRRASC